MDNQEKIFKIKMLPKSRRKKLSCNGKVWMRVKKNSMKRRQKAIVLWKKLAIAASSYCFLIGIPVY
jgi:hypothetical protein